MAAGRLAQPATVPSGEDAGPEEAKQRGQQGQGRDHGEQHADAGGDGQPVQEADAQREHAEQGDAHDDAGEQHGAS